LTTQRSRGEQVGGLGPVRGREKVDKKKEGMGPKQYAGGPCQHLRGKGPEKTSGTGAVAVVDVEWKSNESNFPTCVDELPGHPARVEFQAEKPGRECKGKKSPSGRSGEQV